MLLLGDTGTGTEDQWTAAKTAARAAKERGTHFAIMLGDLIYPSGVRDARDPRLEARLEKPYAPLDKIYLALGNHDHGDWDAAGDPEALVAFARAKKPAIEMPARYYGFGYGFANGKTADFFVL